MNKRSNEIFKNPVQLARPLTVDTNRRLERRTNKNVRTGDPRPKTGGIEKTTANTFTNDFQSNSTSSNFSFANDEEYDTDLEDDMNSPHDQSCIGMYARACHNQQNIPVRAYLKNYDKTELALHYYGLGVKGVQAFYPSLTMNLHITKLDLTSNGLGDKGVIYLSHILRDNIAIVDINLSQNFIGLDGIRALCDMFKDNITINHLRLDGNLLDDECARRLGELISSTGRLLTLNLSKNKLGPASGVFLGQGLIENTTMHSLDLSWNAINGKGAVALIKGIQENVFLKVLKWAHNGLNGADCGKAWLRAFKENTSLAELDMSHNRLTAEPATYIGRAIAITESLQKLLLTGNPLESAGCYALLKPLLAKNVTINRLELIDITENRLNRDFQELYLQIMIQRPDLHILIGKRAPSPLLKGGRRPLLTPMERLRTVFQRRPELDLANFYGSIAVITSDDKVIDEPAIDSTKFKQAIHEKLNVKFSDEDIDQIFREIAQFDCKRFVQTFDNRPATTVSSWRFRS